MKTKLVKMAIKRNCESGASTASNAFGRLALSACLAVALSGGGANAAQMVRPGVFFPEGGPVGVDAVVWRNVKLTDIASFTGKICEGTGNGKNCHWKEAGCYHVTTNSEEGYVQCQLQMKGAMSPTYGFVMQYRQDGPNVKARIVKGGYQSNAAPGEVDFVKGGAPLDPISNTLNSAGYKVRALADLGFVLRDGAEAPAAQPGFDEETFSHIPCISSLREKFIIARNRRVDDIIGMTGEISLKVEQGGRIAEIPWTAAKSYALTPVQGGSSVKMYLLAEVNEGGSKRRAGAILKFDQVSDDVQARIIWAGHQYRGSASNPNYADIASPFGPGFGPEVQTGVTLKVTDAVCVNGVETVGKIAVRNLNVRFRK